MAERLVIHPLNRGARAVKLDLNIEAGKVADARAGTTFYWDFSENLKGKDALDAIQLTQRTGGYDFIAHATAAVRAVEEIARVDLAGAAWLSRNILLALEIIYGHITHFYQTVLPDYISAPGTGPFYGGEGGSVIAPGIRDSMIKNMWRSFDIKLLIHEVIALMGGKAPHLCSVAFGGMTRLATGPELVRISSIIKTVSGFVNNEYSSDVNQIEMFYPQYFNIGGGMCNLLTSGEFPARSGGSALIPPGGINGSVQGKMEKKKITIDCTGSWFEPQDASEGASRMEFKPSPGKQGAYSWVKGAVYDGGTCEVGALARMTVSGNSAVTGLGVRAASVLGRYRARLEESKFLLNSVTGWLGKLDPGGRPAVDADVPGEGQAVGTAEASAGTVVHLVSLKDGRIEKYNVLDPLSWNLCPRTGQGLQGPLEKALIGVAVTGSGPPSDVLRVARSF